jgi:hypothetical protein
MEDAPGSEQALKLAHPSGATLTPNMTRPLFHVFLLGACSAMLSSTAWGAGCEAVKGLRLDHTTIAQAEPVAAGKITTPYGDSIPNLPAFCRVAGVIRPTSDSAIRFEVWLPASGWNGRFLGVGNGGFAGSINYGQMASSLRLGYATASTDTGHEGGAEDASWAYRHPEKIADYGFRGLHLSTLRAKEIVAAVYGRNAEKAYFDACSNGGREALIEAQRFPEDYDGILGGAPANNWTHMLSSGIDVTQAEIGDPAGYISSMKLPAINRAALAACDAGDGVKDGIVSDPASCKFDPAVLLCHGEDSLSCLTAPQVKSLTKLYNGGSTRDGQSLFPGYVPGSELPGWPSWVTGGGPGGGSGGRYAENYFRYMVLTDPTWSILTADPATMLEKAQSATAKDLDATSPDLRGFTARGGKLMMYHGWNDAAISPWNTIAYWKSVRETMGASEEDAAVRLYMVPGMEHCANGPGPNSFGQLGLPAGDGPGSGALEILRGWVEKGTAPGPVLAGKYVGVGKAATEVMKRPLCPYPQRAVYNGSGDPAAASSFTCRAE